MDETETATYQKILNIAIEGFGSKEKAEDWLRNPNSELDGMTPEDLIITEEGYNTILLLLEDSLANS